MREDDATFLRRREQAARDLAKATSNPAVRSIHLSMARTYRDRLGDDESPRAGSLAAEG